MGEKWVVEGNDASHGTNLNTATGENVGGEDAVRVFGKGHIIRHNYLHDFLDEEQFPKSNPHLDAFQTFSIYPASQYASDILIENNYCANIGQMFMGSDTDEAKSGTSRIHNFTLRGNVFRGAHAYAIDHRTRLRPFHGREQRGGGFVLRSGDRLGQVAPCHGGQQHLLQQRPGQCRTTERAGGNR